MALVNGFDVVDFAARMVGQDTHVGNLFGRINHPDLWAFQAGVPNPGPDSMQHQVMAPITLALSHLTLRDPISAVRDASASTLHAMFGTAEILPCSTKCAAKPLLQLAAEGAMNGFPVRFFQVKSQPRPLYMMFSHERLVLARQQPIEMLNVAKSAALIGSHLLNGGIFNSSMIIDALRIDPKLAVLL